MSEIDELMDREAKTYSNQDIELIISYVRKQLAMYDSGGKTAKLKSIEDIDTTSLLANISARLGTKPVPQAPAKKFKRRM